jgi:5-methylcytosine-specific restriction enzyme subunit McrC
MQPVTITLYEHQTRSYQEIGLPPDHPVFEQLDRINQQAKKEIINLGRKGIRANEMIGLVRVNQIIFQILPKIDQKAGEPDGPEGKANAAVLNLLFLLSYAYDLKLYQPDLAHLASRHANWYEILTYLFSSDLHRQIQLGFAQNYIFREENLSVIRGRWDLNRQIGQHAFVKDRFDVTFDEFSPDIRLNRVLRFVVEHLRKTTSDPRNLNLLSDLSSWLEPVTLLPEVMLGELDQVLFNRLNERFQPAFQLARLFLSQQTLSLQGGRTNTFAFVLDMNLLFERFVARFLVRHRHAILPAGWQNIQINPQAQGSSVYLAQRMTSGRPVPIAHLKPDILFQQPGFSHPLMVMDTKYKQLDLSMRRRGVAESDLYQMLAYITRFECQQTVLLYPQPDAQTQIHELFVLEPSQARVWIHTINLHQPLENANSLFQDFQQIFQALTAV